MPNPLAPKKVKQRNKSATFCVLGCTMLARLKLGCAVTVASGVSVGANVMAASVGVAVTTK